MNSLHVKRGDTVLVISGKDKGRTGKIVRALPKKDKVIIEGINIVKKTRRAKKGNEKGQIVDVAVPIHVSNVKKAKARAKIASTKATKVASVKKKAAKK